MKTLEAVETYLRSTRYDGNADLIDRVLENLDGLEIQVNVSGAGGEPVEGKQSTYTDGIDTWYSFRVPRGAFTDNPHWRNTNIRYDLMEHVQSVGSTGWNWKRQVSLWVAFDFDSLVGHAAGVGISDNELERIKQSVQDLDYVEVRQSTGGRGLHLYVMLPEVATLNHTEHAALGRVVLTQMSQDVGFDLFDRVDTCGSNTWIASKRASAEINSFKLLKAAPAVFSEIPEDWKEHCEVIKRKKARVSIGADTDESAFDRLASAHRKVQLDETHLKVRDRLVEMGCCTWNPELNLMTTHTKLLEEIHGEPDMGIQGVFMTSSPGSNLTEPNCFAYPMDGGGWRVYRFSMGCAEHPSWTQDGRTYTSTFFNKPADLKAASTVSGAAQTKKGNFSFRRLEDAINTIKSLSNDPNLDIKPSPSMLERPAIVGKTTTGGVFVETKKHDGDQPGPLWNDVDRRGHWTAVVQIRAEDNSGIILDYDDQIRCLKTSKKDMAGWATLHADGDWDQVNASHAKLALIGLGNSKTEADEIMGHAVRNNWMVTSIPFMPEYSNDRKWNRDAAQLVFDPEPYEGNDDPHPTWTQILNHVGNGLTAAIRNNKYCVENDITTGGEYLLLWIAAMFQQPFEPLPYLALFGQQNTGKSVFGEAISLLVTKGVVNVDRILAGGTEFNGELEGCILGLIEERDIGNSKTSMNKLKQLVTAKEISIRRMRIDSYAVPNSAHYVQTTNDLMGLPKFEAGDTRITLIEVKPFEREIPKSELFDMLRSEGSAFTYTVLNKRLPPTDGRLRLPIIETQLKRSTAALNQHPVDTFIQDYCILDSESSMCLIDFIASLKATSSSTFTQKQITKHLQGLGAVKIVKADKTDTVMGLRLKSGAERDQTFESLAQ